MGLGWCAGLYQTPAFAGKNRLYLAHGRQRSLEGSWRGVTGLRRVSCGLVGARAGYTGIDSCYPSKRPPVSAPGRKQPRQTPKDGERAEAARGSHLRLCASGSLASDAQFGPLLAQDRHIRIAASPRVTGIFQHPGFPGSRDRRAAENSSLPPNRQLSKLRARPAAPPCRPARGFRTNIQTRSNTVDRPAPPERPNQT